MNLNKHVEHLASTTVLLVALDFDGTISSPPLRPESSRPLQGAVEAAHQFKSQDNTHIAIISGRHRENLENVLGDLPRDIVIASHGVDLGDFGGVPMRQITQTETLLLDNLVEKINVVLQDHPQVHVERKEFGVGVGYYFAPADQHYIVGQKMREIFSTVEDLQIIGGKYGVECSVRQGTKGTALDALKRELGVTGILFAGDDNTDEDGFAHLMPGDIGIRVGSGETIAEHRVADEHELVQVIEYLAKQRALHV